MKGKKECRTCAYHQIDIAYPGDRVCTNRDSEKYAEWTCSEEGCECHREKELVA